MPILKSSSITGTNAHVKQSPADSLKTDLLTISEVAQVLRVDDTTVRRWVKQGALEAVVLPHVNARQAYRVRRETLAKVLDTSSLG